MSLLSALTIVDQSSIPKEVRMAALMAKGYSIGWALGGVLVVSILAAYIPSLALITALFFAALSHTLWVSSSNYENSYTVRNMLTEKNLCENTFFGAKTSGISLSFTANQLLKDFFENLKSKARKRLDQPTR